MPWQERRTMSLKIEFVERAGKPGVKIAPLCREYGISRETGYKWLRRFRERGFDGLEEESRRPSESPQALAEHRVVAVLEAREAHPQWGAKKLHQLLWRRFGDDTPSRVSIERILARVGLVRRRRRTRAPSAVERAPEVVAEAPNDVWTVDFKGWWKTLDGSRCEPLTVRDAFSRYVLCTKALGNTSLLGVHREFERLFRKYGIPRAIQSDNGAPFISTFGRAGLTRLSAWWVSLGIQIVRSRPGCPQDNGGHERMHRDLRADVQAFPASHRQSQQRRLDRWRQEFNHVRPHEALGGKVPADLYRPGLRRSLVAVRYEYPPNFVVRRVFGNGTLCLHNEKRLVGRAFVGYRVGLELLENGRYRIWFGDMDLGELLPPIATVEIDGGCERFLAKRAPPRRVA
jgi:transposase InsO family protein